LAVLAAALVVAWLRARRYRAVFRIPARRHDRVGIRGEERARAVTLGPGGFDLPAGALAPGQTAFLRLEVRATAAGRLRDPFIQASAGGRVCRQYFERGVAGRRYLNLSLLLDGAAAGGAPARVALSGSGASWGRDAEILAFDAPDLDAGDVLVLAPHPDDAEIAAFGLYAGRRSWVVTVTAGERGSSDFSGVPPPAAAADAAVWNARLRVWDSLAIPALGDVPAERRATLVYPDGRLAELRAAGGRPVGIAAEEVVPRATLRGRNQLPELRGGGPGCTWAELVAELRLLLDKAAPAVVACPHPLLDPHPDHVFTAVALDEALRSRPPAGEAGGPRLLLYVVHAREAPLYPFGPATSVVSCAPCAEEGWVAESIYSHAVTAELQRAKYFAIEAAHDERVYPYAERKPLGRLAREVKREIAAFVGGTGVRATSFLRRAPRPNEVYYVVSADGLSDLVRRALARQASGRA
jgi:LmbE family N-acetylglucosaminyl deacetylase